eukprot:1158095-Pelagomonas_calceolata.AAC.2
MRSVNLHSPRSPGQHSSAGPATNLAHPSTHAVPWGLRLKQRKSCQASSLSASCRRDVGMASQARDGEVGSSSNMLDTIVDELRQYSSETKRQQDGVRVCMQAWMAAWKIHAFGCNLGAHE